MDVDENDNKDTSQGPTPTTFEPTTFEPTTPDVNEGSSSDSMDSNDEDVLMDCENLSDSEKSLLDMDHPCVSDSCAMNHHSPKCEKIVFEHCCDPEMESCERLQRSTCSAQGCSMFMQDYDFQRDYDKASCPFENPALTCSHNDCSTNPELLRDIMDLFGGRNDKNSCSYGGRDCFEKVLNDMCVNSNVATTRHLGFLFKNTPVSRIPMFQNNKGHRFLAKKWFTLRRKLAEATVTPPEDNNEGENCALEYCPNEYSDCRNDATCLFILENCTGDTQAKECDDKMSETQLFEPLKNCHVKNCDDSDKNEDFLNIIQDVQKCFLDSCLKIKEECDDDEMCRKAFDDLYVCENEYCANNIMMNQGERENSLFYRSIMCAVNECAIDSDGATGTERRACAKVIVSYCETHPNDKGCQSQCKYECDDIHENCPCTSSDCEAVRAAPSCIRDNGVCQTFKEEVLSAYLSKGYFQPHNKWDRERFENFLLTRPLIDVADVSILTVRLQTLRDECNEMHAYLGNHLLACVVPSIQYCNKNIYDESCQTELSICGDGILTWHEQCDDGNSINGDGCNQGCYIERNFICPKSNVPCEMCERDKRANWDDSVCQFCVNSARLEINMISPCIFPSCQSIDSYESAKACDDHVAAYCEATDEAGLSDFGCMGWRNKSEIYTFPTVLNKCEYKIKSYKLNAKNLDSVKIAVITCKFDDPTGSTLDTTPVYKPPHPYNHMSSDTKSKLSSMAKTRLDATLKRSKEFVPLSNLQLDDFYPYVHTDVTDEWGNPIWRWGDRIASLEINFQPQGDHSQFDEWENMVCHGGESSHDLVSLPPTTEPLRMALKAFLMKKKFEARNYKNEYWGNDKDIFESFNLDAIDAGESSGERLNSTAVFAVLLSTTQKYHGQGGQMEEHEQKECILYHQENQENCTSIEENIRSGLATIRFGDSLLQPGCTNDRHEKQECHVVDRCRSVGLVPAQLTIDAKAYSETSANVITQVMAMSDVKSWAELVESYIHVSAAASTTVYDDTMELFNRLVIRGKKTKWLKGVTDYCPTEYYLYDIQKVNPEWENDPCCNHELRQYQCCAPRDVPTGEIDVVLGVNQDTLSTYCSEYTDEVANLLQDLKTNIEHATSCVADLESSVSENVWEEMWKVKDVCFVKMYSGSQEECEADEDCDHCSQSTCQLDGGYGRCTIPYDDSEGCMLECLSAELDPEIIRYLREEWNVAPTAPISVFKKAFMDKMTEPSCSGPRAYEQDIGFNGIVYECDSTCQHKNICDVGNYQDMLRDQATDGNYIDFNNKATCTDFGGVFDDDHYRCTFPNTDTGPCSAKNTCYDTCNNEDNGKTLCAERGGTFLEEHGSCCPSDAYVYYHPEHQRTVCSYIPYGYPSSGEFQDQTCCNAANGSWALVNNYPQCCLGKWVSNTHNGETSQYCREEAGEHYSSECSNTCQKLHSECDKCTDSRNECCGDVYKSTDRTACESYTTCNDASIHEDEKCDDPTPFCAECNGQYCHKRSSPSQCTYDVSSITECEELLPTAGVWNFYSSVCNMADAVSGWDCFSPGPDVCPNPDIPSWLPDDQELPATPWGHSYCNKGCYLTTIMDAKNCDYIWQEKGRDGKGVCRTNLDADSCDQLDGGVFVPYSIGYEIGKFSTEEECNQGECHGKSGYGGWSRDQCETSTDSSYCTRNCDSCVSNYFGHQGHGGCISMNDATCKEIGTISPCVLKDLTEKECSAQPASLEVAWESCTRYMDRDNCNQSDMSKTLALLGCQWRKHQECTSQDQCHAQGECNDWDNSGMRCHDEGWTHGDTCNGYKIETEYDEKSKMNLTKEQHESCNKCQYDTEGVCVRPRADDQMCEDHAHNHPMGCKVYGKYDSFSCTSANTTYTWHTRAKTESDCLAPKGCIQSGHWHMSDGFSPEECERCDGTLTSRYQWNGGEWIKPHVRELKWHASGTHMSPINEWKPVLAEHLLQKELAIPMLRRFANRKQTQALMMYNLFSQALTTLACACGETNDSEEVESKQHTCFDKAEGSLSGVSKAFCGLETPITAACGTVVVKKECLSEENVDGTDTSTRRLLNNSYSSSSMDISWTHYSAGMYTECYAPFTSASDRVLLNPLVVTNAKMMVVGQLLGDGKGMTTNGETFTSVNLCLDLRIDIREWDFGTIDVGKLQDGRIVPLWVTEWTFFSAQTICFDMTEEGVYFPIDRVPSSSASILDDLETNSLACENDKSISLYNASSNTYSCVCRCGFFGETCMEGCLNSCSGAGTCNNGTCECQQGRTGADCNAYDCPIGVNKNRCSGQGLCHSDATCYCDENFTGNDCSELKRAIRDVRPPEGFPTLQMDVDENDNKETSQGPTPPTPPTPTPTTPTPTTPTPTTPEPTTPTPTTPTPTTTTTPTPADNFCTTQPQVDKVVAFFDSFTFKSCKFDDESVSASDVVNPFSPVTTDEEIQNICKRPECQRVVEKFELFEIEDCVLTIESQTFSLVELMSELGPKCLAVTPDAAPTPPPSDQCTANEVEMINQLINEPRVQACQTASNVDLLALLKDPTQTADVMKLCNTNECEVSLPTLIEVIPDCVKADIQKNLYNGIGEIISQCPVVEPKERDQAMMAPEVIPPKSTCVVDFCQDRYDECVDVPGFDSCACYPGFIKCIEFYCSEVTTEALAICEALAATSNVCTLECKAGFYPDAKDAKITFEIEVELSFAGIAASFFEDEDNKQNFKNAMAATIDNTEPSNIKNVVASNSPNARRKLAAGDETIVTFDIELDSPNEMTTAQNTILDVVENTDDGDTPNVFAQEMKNAGVIDDPKQLIVKQSKTQVVVESADDEGELTPPPVYPTSAPINLPTLAPTLAPTPAPSVYNITKLTPTEPDDSNSVTLIAAIVVGVLVILLVVTLCMSKKKNKHPQIKPMEK